MIHLRILEGRDMGFRRTSGTNERCDSGCGSINDQCDLQGKILVNDKKYGSFTYNRTQQGDKTTFDLLKILFGVCLEVKRGLTCLLVRGSLQFNLIFGGHLLHDLTKCCRFAILACGREVDVREGYRIREDRLLHSGSLNARAAPSGNSRGSRGRRGRGKRGKGGFRQGIQLDASGSLDLGLGWSGASQGGKWVRSTFKLVPPL